MTLPSSHLRALLAPVVCRHFGVARRPAALLLLAVLPLALATAWGCHSGPAPAGEAAAGDGTAGEGQQARLDGTQPDPRASLDDVLRPVGPDDLLQSRQSDRDPETREPHEEPAAGEPQPAPLGSNSDASLPGPAVAVDPNAPLLPTLTADEAEALEMRIAALRESYAWPRGMYPFRLREPGPPVEGEDPLVDAWRLISRAQYDQSMLNYEAAIQALEFAQASLDGQPDMLLIAFNLGAAHQQRGEDARQAAVAAYQQVLNVRIDAETDVQWRHEPFRHFAACALAELLMARDDRRPALGYAYAAAFTHPKRDPLTGQAVSQREASDVLLPTLYAYAGLSIADESRRALRVLLTTLRPDLRGASAGDLLANVLAAAVPRLADRPDADDPASDSWPRLYTRAALRTLFQRFLVDYPEHSRRDEFIRLATSADLATGE